MTWFKWEAWWWFYKGRNMYPIICNKNRWCILKYFWFVFVFLLTHRDVHCQILRRNGRDMGKKIWIALHVKYRLFLSDFNESWTFSSDFSKNTQISSLIEIHPVGAELFHVDRKRDRQTDMMKLIVAFHSSAKSA